MAIDKKTRIEWLRQMYTARAFEEMAEKLYALGKIHGTMHLSMGMEASAVGTIAAIEKGDYILGTHRGHSQLVAYGADLNRMMAEFMGKATGYCRGRGGSMHIADVPGGYLGAQGIVAGNIPLAVGVGLTIRNTKSGKICLCFFGDGATNEGAFHESLNMAAIWKLPVVFVCENNQYGMSMNIQDAMAIDKISDRAAAYGMPGVTVDGNDVMAVYEAVAEAVKRARAGEGPSLVENDTYRWRGHSKSDANRYRTKEEIAEWMEKDPIARFQEQLIKEGALTQKEVDNIEANAQAAIDEAVKYADESPEPDVSTIYEGVYAE
ncbi:MAG: thiamine pyrophosphate-dependent dehydrogenase E1 component subunit alpha [Anaerolineaceae bacterium]|jgi:pyruvate dehydrogenase E1 component alpha subunit|nr:thiamine pyrophosphate-dependent dehydrogenase E1 component subunit alpha [Anaerolineaceae bacterium]